MLPRHVVVQRRCRKDRTTGAVATELTERTAVSRGNVVLQTVVLLERRDRTLRVPAVGEPNHVLRVDRVGTAGTRLPDREREALRLIDEVCRRARIARGGIRSARRSGSARVRVRGDVVEAMVEIVGVRPEGSGVRPFTRQLTRRSVGADEREIVQAEANVEQPSIAGTNFVGQRSREEPRRYLIVSATETVLG